MSASLSPPKLRAGAGKAAAAVAKKSATAAAAAVRRLYRVREAGGVQATGTPDIMAPIMDVLEAGTAFYGSAEVRSGVGRVHDFVRSVHVCPWFVFVHVSFR